MHGMNNNKLGYWLFEVNIAKSNIPILPFQAHKSINYFTYMYSIESLFPQRVFNIYLQNICDTLYMQNPQCVDVESHFIDRDDI